MAASLPDDFKSMANGGMPVAKLSIVSLTKLRTRDPTELALLDQAASKTGFFYLDLRGDTEGDRVLAHGPDIYAVAEKFFAQPETAKVKNARLDIKASQDLGWKKGHGGESFEISRDEMTAMGTSIPHLPQLFQDEWKKISEFSAGCDEACTTLLNCLSSDFAAHHRADQPSDTGLKLVSHPSLARLSDVGESLHTDSGTLTLLLFEKVSIHAFLPDSNMWAFTPPLEGCALINVGNALQRLSDGKLHSPKHRVTQPSDGAKERYFLSYFLRPENRLIDGWHAAT